MSLLLFISIYPRFFIQSNTTKKLKLCRCWFSDSLIEGSLLRDPDNYSNFSNSLTEILTMKLNLKPKN